MALATVTTKGQITIPKQIRDSLKLTTGDKIEIVSIDNMQALIKPVSKKVDDVFCRLHDPKRKKVSQQEMNDAVANRMKDKFNEGC